MLPAIVGLTVVALVVVVGAAQTQINVLNDLAALGQGSGQTIPSAPEVKRAEPPFVATPRAKCGTGSHPEPGIQGRVPAGAASDGLSCNVTLLGREGQSGGFKTLRYTDATGRECAYYDTALLFPLNALNLGGTSLGVKALDMTDPAHPVNTDTLTAVPMLTPHESLVINQRRGLIAAVNGNPAFEPGLIAIYDAHADCRHPVLQSTALVARAGHESGFADDGNTFYATGTGFPEITAVDVSDPKNPHPIWVGNIAVHGMTLSPDGNRAYLAAIGGRGMIILDTSEIQARKPNPQARELSWLTWESATIPQNAIRFTEDGHPYILEFDEYTDQAGSTTSGSLSGDPDKVGAARIIDIADETAPRVVANLRLQVNQPANHKAAGNDPGAFSPVQGYAAHYCNIPTPTDPKVVACAFITSGLRIFDISDVTAPKEIAYYVAPTQPKLENGFMASSYAMGQPVIVGSRHEVWYTDGATGFYALRVASSVWPGAAASANDESSSGSSPSSSTRRRASTKSTSNATAQAAAAATGSTGSGTLPFTGQDLRLPFFAGLLLLLAGALLRRLVTGETRWGRTSR